MALSRPDSWPWLARARRVQENWHGSPATLPYSHRPKPGAPMGRHHHEVRSSRANLVQDLVRWLAPSLVAERARHKIWRADLTLARRSAYGNACPAGGEPSSGTRIVDRMAMTSYFPRAAFVACDALVRASRRPPSIFPPGRPCSIRQRLHSHWAFRRTSRTMSEHRHHVSSGVSRQRSPETSLVRTTHCSRSARRVESLPEIMNQPGVKNELPWD